MYQNTHQIVIDFDSVRVDLTFTWPHQAEGFLLMQFKNCNVIRQIPFNLKCKLLRIY
jgi:hypothetical protein